MKKEEQLLIAIIKECKKHLKRMNLAYENIKGSLPITPERVFNLTDNEVLYLDQIIFQFSKLQDAIGQKLFKAVLIILGEDVLNKSAIDIFNRLEQLEVIENYQNWKELRDIRNELAHEYEDNETDAANKLNLLFNKKDHLIKYLDNIMNFLKRKGYDV